ncbi:hypothetical protein [Nocardia tengchongensis]|uniref:hypothetical protein n=1 Tax=Nocardia tengchongensis TaxID=2055889 RepID=UPI0036C017FC
MHTATQLNESMFSVELDGTVATLGELFPAWGPNDRFGIVVHEPFGAIGASLLIQAAITAFFDCVPERRTSIAQYPEIYIFSVGRTFGDHSMFDFWPPRKEVVVPADPIRILDAINDRAITRLAVPDGVPLPVDFADRMAAGWSEVNSTLERVSSAFAYSSNGQLDNSDISITATSGELESNGMLALDPDQTLNHARSMTDAEFAAIGPYAKRDAIRFIEFVSGRIDEFPSAVRTDVALLRQAITRDGRATESYRRISGGDALALLVPSQ